MNPSPSSSRPPGRPRTAAAADAAPEAADGTPPGAPLQANAVRTAPHARPGARGGLPRARTAPPGAGGTGGSGAYRLVRAPVVVAAPPELDAAQRAVVEHAAGPLLVLAGPGTGKTTTLVEAATARVRAGTPPERILVLTFSRSAAVELRDRMAARAGAAASAPQAATFHSFCYALVREHQDPELFAEPLRLLSGPEQDLLVRELLAGQAALAREGRARVRWPDDLRAALGTRGFADEVRAVIARSRELGLGPQALADFARRIGRPDWRAAAEFLQEYLDVTDLQGVVDYTELVHRAVRLVRRPEVYAELAGRYDAVYVDEYQDTDAAQVRLLEALAGQGRTLVAFGDPDQSIYAFRGADVNGILGFPYAFPTAGGAPAPVAVLTAARRSSPRLLAATRQLATRMPLPRLPAAAVRAHRAPVPVRDAGPADGVSVRTFPTPGAELDSVADTLRRAHLEDGIPWRDMAVLTRSATPLPALRRALTAAGVPVDLEAAATPLHTDPAVAPLLHALRLAATPSEPPAAGEPKRSAAAAAGPADPVSSGAGRLTGEEAASGDGRARGSAAAEAPARGAAVPPREPGEAGPAAAGFRGPVGAGVGEPAALPGGSPSSGHGVTEEQGETGLGAAGTSGPAGPGAGELAALPGASPPSARGVTDNRVRPGEETASGDDGRAQASAAAEAPARGAAVPPGEQAHAGPAAAGISGPAGPGAGEATALPDASSSSGPPEVVDGPGVPGEGVEEAIALLMSPLGGMDAADLRRLGRALREEERAAGRRVPRASDVLVAEALAHPEQLVAHDASYAGRVVQLGRRLAQARATLAAGGTAEDALWQLWDGSAWSGRLERAALRGGPAGRNADRDLDAVCALFATVAHAEERTGGRGALNLIEELSGFDIAADTLAGRAVRPDAVRLTTAHRAKGLEWRLVVVTGVQEGVWPDLRRRGSLLEADRIGSDGLAPPLSQGALLAEERRLFYVAATRARDRLLVTAVQSAADDGDRPSRFLTELGVEPRAVTHRPRRPLAVSALVAELRATTVDPGAPPELRAAAAQRLARLAVLADDGHPMVPAAHPDRWWGLYEPTRSAMPVRDRDQPVALSGSALDQLAGGCSLQWFLGREVKAEPPSTAAQGFGNVVHVLADEVASGRTPADLDVLMARLDSVWDALAFDAPWKSRQEKDTARAALERFLRWHVLERGRTPVATEQDFDVTLEAGDVQVRIRGSMDRVETDAEGRAYVVDFKTGRAKPSAADVARHPQLAVYQLAVREGAVDPLFGGERPPAGGAELVQLRLGATRKEGGDALPAVQRQDALADDWPLDLLAQAAGRVLDERFTPATGRQCTTCAFRGACTARPEGRHVVE